MKRIAIVGNSAATLVRFRLDLIRALVRQGHKVYALSPGYRHREQKAVEEAGAIPVTYRLNRLGTNPVQELRLIGEFKRKFLEYEIDTVFSYFLKPVVYGSIAAHRAGITEIYSMFGGLGFVFSRSRSLKHKLQQAILKPLVCRLIKYALSKNRTVFFQNPDDLEEFVRSGLVEREKCKRVYGSGVHLKKFAQAGSVTDPVTFVMTGRLLEEKGFRDFYLASRQLKKNHPDIRCVILGGLDHNPGGIPAAEIKSWVEEGVVEWPGRVRDVHRWLEESSVFVLPSYYREGTPRSALEALSTGLPIITTDEPGCRETVREGENGYLIPSRSPKELARAMELFILNPEKIEEMGQRSRELAEELYDVRKVNAKILRNLGAIRKEEPAQVREMTPASVAHAN